MVVIAVVTNSVASTLDGDCGGTSTGSFDSAVAVDGGGDVFPASQHDHLTNYVHYHRHY